MFTVHHPSTAFTSLKRAFVPQNKYSARSAGALIPVITAINRASRTRGVMNNERSSRRKLAGAPQRRARANVPWRGEEGRKGRGDRPQPLPKTYGSVGRVISCLLDRLYVLSAFLSFFPFYICFSSSLSLSLSLSLASSLSPWIFLPWSDDHSSGLQSRHARAPMVTSFASLLPFSNRGNSYGNQRAY